MSTGAGETASHKRSALAGPVVNNRFGLFKSLETTPHLVNVSITPISRMLEDAEKNDPGHGWENVGTGLGGIAGAAALIASTDAAEGAAEVFLVSAGFRGFAAAGISLGLGLAALFAGLRQNASKPADTSSPPSPPFPPGSSAVEGDPPDKIGDIEQALLDEMLLLDLTIVPEPGQLPGAGDLAPSEGDFGPGGLGPGGSGAGSTGEG